MNNHTQYNLALTYHPIEQKNEVSPSNDPGRMTGVVRVRLCFIGLL